MKQQQREASKSMDDDALPDEWDEFGDGRDWDWQFGDESAELPINSPV